MHTLHELTEFYNEIYQEDRLLVKSCRARKTLFCPMGYRKETDKFWGHTLSYDHKGLLKTKRPIEYHEGSRRIWVIPRL